MAAHRILRLNRRSLIQACQNSFALKTDVDPRRSFSSGYQRKTFVAIARIGGNCHVTTPGFTSTGYLTSRRHFRAAGPSDNSRNTPPTSDRRKKGEYIVYVKTGDQIHAGTDAAVSITLHSENGNQTAPIKLDYPFRDDFERGQLDEFRLKRLKHIPDVQKIEIFRKTGPVSSDWFVDYIEIACTGSGERYFFPVFRWIKPNKRYVIRHMDNFLPQLDPEPHHRAEELREKKAAYQVKMKVPGGPAQVGALFFKRYPSPDDPDVDIPLYATQLGSSELYVTPKATCV